MGRRIFTAGLLLFTLFLAVPLQAGVFNPSVFTLKNGMQLVVVVNGRAPVVSHMLWLKVGAADEEEGQTGLAHYLEHLMFKGTARVPNGEYSRRIARVGGNENAFTSLDYTAYFATVAPQHLPLVMELEADRLVNLAIAEDLAKPELAVVLDERRQRIDNDPFGVFSQEMQAGLFPAHGYGRPVIGWQQDVERLNAAKAQAFYKKWYNPAHAVVVVSGDVEPEKVHELAARFYGTLPAGPFGTRARNVPPPFTGHMKIEDESARVQDTTVMWSVRVPSRRMDRDMADALEVLGQVLAGTDGAVLSKRMIGEGKLATSFDVSYEPDTLDESSFSFSFIVAKGVDASAAIAALEKHVKALSEKPLPQADLEAAKSSLSRAAVLARDSVMGPAYAFGMALTTGQSVEDVEGWPDRIRAVSPERLQKALAYLASARHVVGIMRPREGAPLPPRGAAPALPKPAGGVLH